MLRWFDLDLDFRVAEANSSPLSVTAASLEDVNFCVLFSAAFAFDVVVGCLGVGSC